MHQSNMDVTGRCFGYAITSGNTNAPNHAHRRARSAGDRR
ncbi:hypothetical protein OCU_25000 [Mycobacterium intracellulare ATCC 13950]|uniref:Uncharacterized protein n=1 Tax=Mycobacterium intracellulare (strain ATCC 13950 / DSM 43223 / JCM 6384 / NCTC 13025 / 3600) TaxID=487521 RepID=H8IK49_MYCIA|nr:hypothetical protein OCU_25000 [Mycobacterium intracellulare ATCC 13950]